MIETHANYDAALMKSLVNKIGYYENAGDYGKLTHCMIYLMWPCGCSWPCTGFLYSRQPMPTMSYAPSILTI